jgi:hypothetical protein
MSGSLLLCVSKALPGCFDPRFWAFPWRYLRILLILVLGSCFWIVVPEVLVPKVLVPNVLALGRCGYWEPWELYCSTLFQRNFDDFPLHHVFLRHHLLNLES